MNTLRRFGREPDLHDWPLFSECPSSNDAGVVSIESIRNHPESIADAVGRASSILATTWPAHWTSPLLLAVVPPRHPYNTLMERKLRNSGIRNILLDDQPSLRQATIVEEVMIDCADGIGFVGLIEVDPIALPSAMEIVRRAEAVCVVDPTVTPAELLDDLVLLAEASYQPGKQRVLLTATARMGPQTVVLRAYGAFDDRYVGIDVFGYSDTLDSLWERLPKE